LSRKRLIKLLKDKNPKLNHLEIEKILNTFSKSIFNSLKNGKSVEIREIGR